MRIFIIGITHGTYIMPNRPLQRWFSSNREKGNVQQKTSIEAQIPEVYNVAITLWCIEIMIFHKKLIPYPPPELWHRQNYDRRSLLYAFSMCGVLIFKSTSPNCFNDTNLINR